MPEDDKVKGNTRIEIILQACADGHYARCDACPMDCEGIAFLALEALEELQRIKQSNSQK